MGDTPIKIVIADPQEVSRIGLRMILEQTSDCTVGAETGCGEEALNLVREAGADVLVTEVSLADCPGWEVVPQVREKDSSASILVVSAYEEEQYVRRMLAQPIAGYLLKHESPEYIVEAIRGAARGEEGWISLEVAQKTLDQKDEEKFSSVVEQRCITIREREVLHLMMRGQSNQQIADQLYISKNTVRSHVSNIYAKLDVSSRSEVVAWAWENGFLEERGGDDKEWSNM